ncbi:MAG: AI-2E family transporter, partial [Haloarculaceae archaeon]
HLEYCRGRTRSVNREQWFLLAVLLVSASVSLLIVMPFLQYVLGAIVAAYVLYPLYERVRPRLGRRIAPLFVVATATILAVLPLGYVVLVLIQDLSALARGETNLDTETLEANIRRATGQEVDVSQSISTLGDELRSVLFGNVTEVVSVGSRVTVGLLLSAFLVYYLLRDGEAFVAWLIDVVPMSNAVCDRLFERIDRTAWGVIVGHLFVAFLQGLVGGLGLLIAGVPNAAFWTFVMLLLALLPLIGAFIVWAPASAYLVAVGRPGWGLFLFVYGLVVVGLIDNYARPIVIDREAHLNPAVVLVGVFGGVYAIGMIGLFLGPVVLAVLAATIEAFDTVDDELVED